MRNVLSADFLLQSYHSLQTVQSAEGKAMSREPIDTSKPMDICEEEELERISALLQRDNLVRGLGIVEHVYRLTCCYKIHPSICQMQQQAVQASLYVCRLLHCTPGTMGIQLKNEKFSVCIFYPYKYFIL